MSLLVKLLQSKGWMKPNQASVLASLRHLPADVQDDVANEVVRVFGAMKSVPKNDPRHALLATQLDELMNPEKMVGGTPTAMDRADAMFPVMAYSGRKKELVLDPKKVLQKRGEVSSNVSPDGVNRDVARFLSQTPDTAATYVEVDDDYMRGEYTLPARLNLGKNLEIDAEGADWGGLRMGMIEDDPIVAALMQKGYTWRAPVTTDTVAKAAGKQGYDSVTFRNIRDYSDTDRFTPTDTVYAMLNQSGIRAKTAKFSPYDKRKYDILASLLATGGLGGGLLALSKRNEESA
jgi:hypothetical protein